MQAGSTAIGEKFNQIKYLRPLSNVEAQNKSVQKQRHATGIESIA
jgi:K+-transporting ATPase c subunit